MFQGRIVLHAVTQRRPLWGFVSVSWCTDLKSVSVHFCTSGYIYSYLSLFLYFFSPSRGPHPWPEAPALQRDAVSAAEGGAGQDKEEAAGQRRALHLGDRRGQVHAALLPHGLLALLWEAQWRLVMAAENSKNNKNLVVKKKKRFIVGSTCMVPVPHLKCVYSILLFYYFKVKV